MLIPETLVTAAAAESALREYLAWSGPKPDAPDFVAWEWAIRHRAAFTALELPAQLSRALDRHPGPGPVVSAHLPGDAPRLLGRPLTADGRPVLTITEPLSSEYGLVVTAPTAQLAELVAGIRQVRLLAARCGTCAAADRDRGGRARQAERLEHEAEALTTYAGDLERHVRPLGDHFLDDWRAEAVRHAPKSSPGSILTAPVVPVTPRKA